MGAAYNRPVQDGAHDLRTIRIMADHEATDLPPVFVGGSGRSGTSVIARLVAKAPGYALVPVEARFHTDPGGLPDVVRGEVAPGDFVRVFRKRWYRRGRDGGARGLHVVILEREIESTLQRFLEVAPEDLELAARNLMVELFGIVASRVDARSWVEMTPPAVRTADVLGRLLPEARFVHTVRDGRDVAASVVPLPWGPSDFSAALRWWKEEVLAADRATRELGPQRVHVLRFEELFGTERDVTFGHLVRFLEVSDESEMRTYLDRTIRADHANLGRWMRDVPAEEHADIEAVHNEVMDELRATGVTWATTPAPSSSTDPAEQRPQEARDP